MKMGSSKLGGEVISLGSTPGPQVFNMEVLPSLKLTNCP